MERDNKSVIYLNVEELTSLIKSAVTDAINNKHLSNPKENKELLTIHEAAEFLRLSVATLYTMNCRNQIPMTKVSGKVYYKRSALMEWLDSGDRKTKVQLQTEVRGGK